MNGDILQFNWGVFWAFLAASAVQFAIGYIWGMLDFFKRFGQTK